MNSKKISIIIPAYNEEDGLVRALGGLMPLARINDWEVIVVNDGSSDSTADVVLQNEAKLISHPYNKGYGASLKTGIRNATGEIVVIMDSDGQHKAADIEKLLKHMENYEMVIGARSKDVLIRAPGKKLLSIVANFLCGMKIPDLNSGFRAFYKDTVKSFMHFCPNGFSFSTTITLAYLREGFSVKYVPIEAEARVGRASSVKYFRDGYNAFMLIIRVIVLFNPLKVFMPASMGLFFLGALFTLYGIIVFGKAPNTGILIILSSVILFFMGILADQISSIRRERRF